MPEYMGPKLDEINLGTLTGGDFFGELSLLPLRSQWHYSRTTTAVQNAYLYFITRRKVELLSEKYPDLRRAYTFIVRTMNSTGSIRELFQPALII